MSGEFDNIGRPGFTCSSHHWGHHVFGWGVVKSLGAKPRIPAVVKHIEGKAFAVTVAGVTEVWFNHDPDRLTHMLGRYKTVKAVASHYITIGGPGGEYWFSFSLEPLGNCT